MAVGGRTFSESGYYHVVSRGNGRQNIFESDDDRRSFVELLSVFAGRNEVDVIAWCLMGNHVHLILRDDQSRLSETMQCLLTTYSRRFNRRERHAGHVFQARFSSAPIEDDRYLLAAVRYVHLNPERAGICPASEYEWSSYQEYVGTAERMISDTAVVLDMLGGPAGFVELCASASAGMVSYSPHSLCRTPDEVGALARSLLGDAGLASPSDVKALPREERNEALRLLRAGGLSIREIERVTGVGRGTVHNAVRETES